MEPEPFAAFYQSDLQSVYLLLLAPLGFLVYRAFSQPTGAGLDPVSAPFIRLYTWVFAIETIVDPIATGPLSKALGIAGQPLGTALMFCFVWLGDYRVFALIFGLGHSLPGLKRPLLQAARWSFVVPIVAGGVFYLGLQPLDPEIHGQWLWVVYEASFCALALFLRRRGPGLPRAPELARYRAALLGYVASYYALWAAADLLILVGGLDAGWALRVLPNQLYYGFWIPFVWARFFHARSASSSTSTQASR